jgi:hypothetical protein
MTTSVRNAGAKPQPSSITKERAFTYTLDGLWSIAVLAGTNGSALCCLRLHQVGVREFRPIDDGARPIVHTKD